MLAFWLLDDPSLVEPNHLSAIRQFELTEPSLLIRLGDPEVVARERHVLIAGR
jgi:hypothetical protein